MNKNEQLQFETLLGQLDTEQLRRINSENNMSKMSSYNDPKNQNVVELQLDLEKIKSEMENLLLGRELKIINGNERWVESSDDRTRVWSDVGVKQIMSVIHFYVNANTLLSCFDDEQILKKVYTLGVELNDLIFNQLELFLYYPTPEELFYKYSRIIKINNLNFNTEELYKKCNEWSIAELRSKENYYPITVIKILDMVHSTYLRALNGEERESLRKQMMIHQSLQNQMPYSQPQSKGIFK